MSRRPRISLGGRPRHDGERFPCGRLRPPPPNPKVVAQRRALIGEEGDLTKASHPLDLALARGWITERQHRTGTAFAGLYRRARLDAPDGEGQGRIREVREDQGERSARFSGMTDGAIAEAFDRVFDDAGGDDPEAAAAAAGAVWRRLNALMTPGEQAEVFLVCVRASWPQWIIQRAAGRFDSRWEDRRILLTKGLDAMAGPRRAKTGALDSRAAPIAASSRAMVRRGPEERTSYVTPDGELLFEVVRKGRREGRGIGA